MKKRIILAGGSGLLGQALAEEFSRRDFDVVVLTRRPRRKGSGVRDVYWDGINPGPWEAEFEAAMAVINLTGKSVNCRHTAKNCREMMDSRIQSVLAVGRAMRECRQPPRLWIQAGSLAIYGNSGDRVCDESAPPGSGFSVEICRRWEQALASQETPDTRKVVLRIGFVLSREGGALKLLERLTRLFLGGAVGNGRQFISWIHMHDFIQLVFFMMEHQEVCGAFNVTSPEPAMNAEFMRSLRHALRRPWSPPVPATLTRIGAWLMGTDGELALTGRRGIPQRMTDQGFTFAFPTLREALEDIYGADRASRA